MSQITALPTMSEGQIALIRAQIALGTAIDQLQAAMDAEVLDNPYRGDVFDAQLLISRAVNHLTRKLDEVTR